VSLAQPHVALLLLQRIGTLRARRHKARLVTALGEREQTGLDQLRRVRWAVEIGDAPGTATVLGAARAAVGAADGPTAEVLLGHLERSGDEMEARQLRAELAFRRGQMDRAEQLLDQIDLAQLEPRTAATVLRRRATIRFHVRGRYDEAIAMLQRSEQEVPAEQRNVLVTHRLGLQGFMGRADAVLAERSILDDDLDELQYLEVLRALGQALTLRGRLGEALELLDLHERRSETLPPATAQPGHEVAMSTAIAAHAALGDLATAGDLVRQHLPVGRRTLLAWLPMAAARVELAAGRPRSARELLTTPLAAVQSQNLLHAEPLMTALVARAELQLGDVEAAARRADLAAKGVEHLGGQLHFALVFALAEVWIETDQRERAREHLLGSAEAARSIGALVTEAELLGMAALSGAAPAVVTRIGELAEQIEGELWPVVRHHVEVLAGVDGGSDLSGVAEAYRRIGYVRLAELTASASSIVG
jgi:tetratricopeptide (TPR) repeat protein